MTRLQGTLYALVLLCSSAAGQAFTPKGMAAAIRARTSLIKSYEISFRRQYADTKQEVPGLELSDGEAKRYDLGAPVHGGKPGEFAISRNYLRDGRKTTISFDGQSDSMKNGRLSKSTGSDSGVLFHPNQLLGQPLDQVVERGKIIQTSEEKIQVQAILEHDENATISLDPKNSFFAKAYSVERKGDDGLRKVSIEFEGWQDFDGISLPTFIKDVEMQDGKIVEAFSDTILEVKLNQSVAEALKIPRWKPGTRVIDVDKRMRYEADKDGNLKEIGPANIATRSGSSFNPLGLGFVVALGSGVFFLCRMLAGRSK